MLAHRSFGKVPAEVIRQAALAPVGESVKLIRKHEPYFAFTSLEFKDLIDSKSSEIEDIKSDSEEFDDDIDDLEEALRYVTGGHAHAVLKDELKSMEWDKRDRIRQIESLQKEIKSLKKMMAT